MKDVTQEAMEKMKANEVHLDQIRGCMIGGDAHARDKLYRIPLLPKTYWVRCWDMRLSKINGSVIWGEH